MQCASANKNPSRAQEEIPALAIKRAILERGETISSIARSLGYARNTVSLCVHHPRLFPAVRRQILQRLDLL